MNLEEILYYLYIFTCTYNKNTQIIKINLNKIFKFIFQI